MRKLFAFVLTAVVLQATPALALVGGPWGNNSHEENSDGIFSATMILKGGVGLASWSQVSSLPEISRFAESVVWYKGAVYFGTTLARVDVQARSVTGVTNGEVATSGITLATPSAGPVAFCTTSWRGKVKDTSNSLSFSAKGDASFFGDYTDEFLPSTVIETTDTAVTIDPISGQATKTVVTTTTQTIPGAGGPNAAFPRYKNRTSVLVYGSRVSTVGQIYPNATTSRTGFGVDAFAAAGGGGGGGGGGG
ncbi:MAG: hypothetical protein O3C21_08290 [Verrucomicrobia bacterium]|nr:hypothetical protein [Verrucomicrobiota bacterium]